MTIEFLIANLQWFLELYVNCDRFFHNSSDEGGGHLGGIDRNIALGFAFQVQG
jgi:hypothetical protein